jgi:ABC-type polysaccharide/polyol phosphate export permease
VNSTLASESPSVATAPSSPIAEDLDDAWLPPVDERRSLLRDYRDIFGRELWGHRGLLIELVRRDIRVRYKQAVMGFAWAILVPTLVVVAGALVRVAMAYVGGRRLEFQEIAGMALKALPWSFFVGALNFGTNSLTVNANLVTKIYFPREILPLAATLAQAFDSSIGLGVLLLVSVVLGVHFGSAMVWVPVLALCLVLFTAGTALVASCANLFFRDVKYLVHVFVTFGIFFTPVLFEPEMFGPVGARLMMLNPLAPILEGLRLCTVANHNLMEPLVVAARHGSVLAWSPWYLAYSAIWAVVLFMGGLVVFHRAEPKFAEYV